MTENYQHAELDQDDIRIILRALDQMQDKIQAKAENDLEAARNKADDQVAVDIVLKAGAELEKIQQTGKKILKTVLEHLKDEALSCAGDKPVH